MKNNKISDINIAYIGGGSKGWAWTLMRDLAIEEMISGEVKLYDINYDAALKNERIGNNLFLRKEVKSKWKFKAVKTLKEALVGADFIIISIIPGTFKEMSSDVHEPEKYNIYQPVGDTVGPGGMMRALRIIPIYKEFARAIKECAKDAWVINYTNPMSICTRVLYEFFPGIKAFGCCHEIFHTQDLLVDVVREFNVFDTRSISREDIKINVLGINHCTWIVNASYKEMDLFPLYNDFVNKYYDTGYEAKADISNVRGSWKETVFSSAQRVKFDLFKRFGFIAAAGDRHLAEFIPDNYLKDKETIESWKFHLTPVSWRLEDNKNKEKRSELLASGKDNIELKASGEEGVKQIKALLGLEDLITNVNFPNIGQMKNVPYNSIVETNALFRKNRVQPIISGELPGDVNKIINIHIDNQETIINSVIKEDVRLAYKAFVNDPLIKLKDNEATALFHTMLDNIREYVPEYLFQK